MATMEELQKEHEAHVDRLLGERGGRGRESDLALVRALVHRAVHHLAERKAGEFCTLAVLLAEMTGHGHDVMHREDRGPGVHGDVVH